MRKILQIEVHGIKLVGTYHDPAGCASTALERHPRRAAVGIVLFNIAQLPRAGLGDMPVEMADRLANRGYPVFRFDLPGLGDSPGDLPEQVQEQWRLIQEGAYASCAGALTTELKRRFDLQGVILGGLCGGAINAIYATVGREPEVLGLVLLEPNFFLLGMAEPQIPKEASLPARIYLRGMARMKENRRLIRARLLKHRFGDRLRAVYTLAKRARDYILGLRLPADANLQLIDGCRRLAARGIPMLVLTASNNNRRLIRHDVFGQNPNERVTFVEVKGTNHMLIPGGGKQVVLGHVEQWVQANFPLDADEAASRTPALDEQMPISK